MQAMSLKTWDGYSDTLLDWLRFGHLPGHDQETSGPDDGQRRKRGPGRLAVAAVLALAILAAWYGLSRGPEAKVVTAKLGNAAEVIYATGAVEPVQWAKITAVSRRRIVEICNCEGQAVQKGEVLARLEDREERALLAEMEARLTRLKEDAARIDALVKRNAAARATLDEKLTQVREQEARMAALQVRIEDLQLRSPIDGIVLRRDGEIGEIAGIGSNDALLWVGQPRPLRVVAEVNEDDILMITIGQKALLRHEAQAGAPMTAIVASITPAGDPDLKTFRVYLTLPDDTPLKIGMSVEANIIVREALDVVIVPAEAVANGTVQVVKDQRIVETPVEVGIRGTTMVEVRKGLDIGDSIASPHVSGVTTGDAIRPIAVELR